MTTDEAILSFNPWEGGKGDDPYRVLKNRMVVARVPHQCAICWGVIQRDERHRAQTEANLDGSKQVKTFRFCAECCAAMPSWFLSSSEETISARYALGEQRARASR
jgi:hypothetical protein